MRRKARERGFEIVVDSAGTGDWHVGELADPRARRVGQDSGCEMTMRARQLASRDFDQFDLIVVMDRNNLREVQGWRGAKPEKVRLAMSFVPESSGVEVPDPYYGDIEDFQNVALMLEAAADGILGEWAKAQGTE